ncbi:hypothetical protein SAMN05421786_102539 [Chryseobacterium ureilyticum]|uniref:Uncharacterized protein n=1 Tax=Chryseobacterium ureilyticum TaxID=373668 RepID=A0A1N7MF69_9FLAO|nr:hypothetical protein [Chryseobacterium ureilyticum]SIS84743.1 hypothetical protein SAMN05421786_102539 [Chryseobacterium ureilyticum]
MKTNSYFDLSAFEKVEDIIYLDEPILSHLKLNEKDYFLYLVDSIEDYDVFLFFEIDTDTILKYLTKSISLREIIKGNNILLILEQDYEGTVINTQSILCESLSEDYLPETNSFLEYEPLENSFYYEMINDYNRKLYLHDLRKNAFYLKFSTNDRKYGDTIGLRELTNTLLTNLSTSFKHFVTIDFEKKFNSIIPEDNKRNKVLKSVFADTDLRMVDLNFGSFEIGLSTDKLMKSNIEFKEVKEWADNVGDNYKKIVLDNDITNTELATILNNYTDEERNQIFEPVLRIVENNNYNLKVKGSVGEKYSNLGLNNKEVSSKIVTKIKKVDNIQQKHLELITVTTIIDKNSNKKTINLDNTLFSSIESTEYLLGYSDFKKYGYNNVPNGIKITILIENNDTYIVLRANYNENAFEVRVDNDKIEEGIKKMVDKIYEYTINL